MYYLVIIISVISYVASNLLFAKHIRQQGTFLVNFYRTVSLTIIMSWLLFFANFSHFSLHYLGLSVLFWFCWVIYFLSHLKAYQFLPAGIVSSIISLESIVVIVLSYFLYSEQLTLYWYIGALLLIFSWILLWCFKSNHSHLDTRWYLWILLAFIWMLWWAFWGFGFAYLSRELDIFTWVFLSELSIFLILSTFILLFKSLRKNIILDKKVFWNIFISSFAPALATSMFFYSTVLWDISVSILFLSLVPILLSISSYFIFNEKLHWYQWLLIIVWFIGLLFVNL